VAVRVCYADNDTISVFAIGAARSTSTHSRNVEHSRNFRTPRPEPLYSEVLQRGNNTHAPIAVLPGGECELSGQPKQEQTAEAARVAEYVPAPQSTQELAAIAPVVARYLPAPQSVHEADPRASLYLPAPQSVHEAEPIESLYFPAAHVEHMSPTAPVYPALH
jgi:hypothetical protein